MELKNKFSNDIVFRLVFGNNLELTRGLVAAALGVPSSSIKDIEMKGTELAPEKIGGKFCRLDLNLIVDGQQIDLEIQLSDEGNFKERALFYWSKLFASALKEGCDYATAPRTFLISVVDFNLFGADSFSSDFGLFERARHELLTDKLNLIFFELPKLPERVNMGEMIQVWLKVLSAKTEDDLKELEEMEVEFVSQAVTAYRSAIASDEYLELERIREKARFDEANALSVAQKRGEILGEKRGEKYERERIIENLRGMGLSEKQIKQAVTKTT